MANELSGIIRFAGLSLDDLVVTPAESLHVAVADRVFGVGGSLAAPARFLHHRIARKTYGAARRSLGATTTLVASAAELITGDEAPLLSRTKRGRGVVAALNGLAGDRLDRQGNSLAIPMSVFAGGADVPCRRESLRRAFPDPTRRVAVFLHGLGETPESWRRGRHNPFGTRLRRDLGITPAYVRYNSGLQVGDNGSRLSRLLDDLVAEWPVRVRELILIGHSMGGLVARAACDSGAAGGAAWTAKVRHLITLGSPHTGVPLEKLVHAAAGVLRGSPAGAPFAEILDLRSAGIRDLRHGYVSEELAPGARRLTACTYTFITASVARHPRHPLSWLAGDLLVRSSSAAGKKHDGEVVVASDNLFHMAPLTHFDLLDNPEVYRRVRDVLSSAPH